MKELLLGLETDDFQNRKGDYPKSDIPDTISTSEEGSKFIVELSFKNTSEKDALKWSLKYLIKKGFVIDSSETYQDGDFEDDWVMVVVYIKD